MKKINIKIVSLLFIVIAISISCEKEQIQRKGPEKQNPQLKTIIVDGKPMYSGYGYDPVKDRAYRNAISPWSTFESTDIKEALSVEVEVIETKQQLERFVSNSYSVNSGFNLVVFSLNASVESSIENKITIDANHVTVVARIKSRSHKYICDRYPMLESRAEGLVNNNDIKRFVGNYGVMYVDTRVTGGEVYYVYNYDYRLVSKWNKSVFKSKVSANISQVFGLSVSSGVTSEEKNLINNAQKSAGITSTVPGFAPQIVTELNQVDREIQALQNYLNSHPEKATTAEMKVRPYHSFLKYDYPGFASKMEAEYNKYIEEYSDKSGS